MKFYRPCIPRRRGPATFPSGKPRCLCLARLTADLRVAGSTAGRACFAPAWSRASNPARDVPTAPWVRSPGLEQRSQPVEGCADGPECSNRSSTAHAHPPKAATAARPTLAEPERACPPVNLNYWLVAEGDGISCFCSIACCLRLVNRRLRLDLVARPEVRCVLQLLLRDRDEQARRLILGRKVDLIDRNRHPLLAHAEKAADGQHRAHELWS